MSRRGRLGLIAGVLLWSVSAAHAAEAPDALRAAQESIDAGRAQEALELLAPRLEEFPKDAQALLLRSTARLMLGLPAGLEDLDRALQLDPELRQGWLNRAAVDIANGDFRRALEAFRRAERLAPGDPDNSLNIGAALLLSGDVAAATARFRDYLQKKPSSADAYYLVASNYGMVGETKLAIEALGYAIQIDEKTRRRARVDPNFSDVGRDPRFRQLLETDVYRPPSGALTAARRFDAGFTGPDSRLLDAVIRGLELLGEPFDPQIEVATEWALIWTESFRVKIAREELAVSRVELTAAPGSYRPDVWDWKTGELFRHITVQLFGMKAKTPGR